MTAVTRHMRHEENYNPVKTAALRPACSAKLSLATVIVTFRAWPFALLRWRVVVTAGLIYVVANLWLSVS